MDKNKLTVVCFIIKRKKILIGEKREDSKKFMAGKWHIPAGSEKENDFYEASSLNDLVKNIVSREMREETNLTVETIDIIDITYIAKLDVPKNTIVVWVYCEVVSGELQAGSDLEDVRWVKLDDLYQHIDPHTTYSMPASVRVFLKSKK